MLPVRMHAVMMLEKSKLANCCLGGKESGGRKHSGENTWRDGLTRQQQIRSVKDRDGPQNGEDDLNLKPRAGWWRSGV
jgi:hypothetical protein